MFRTLTALFAAFLTMLQGKEVFAYYMTEDQVVEFVESRYGKVRGFIVRHNQEQMEGWDERINEWATERHI